MSKIRIILVDDHTIFREGLRSLLADESDMEVVGEASTGEGAVALAATLKPEIIVMDISMPGGNLTGLHAASVVQEQNPCVRVIVLSMSADEESLNQAIQAGVNGYVVKQSAASELLTAIRAVHGGEAYFSPPMAKMLLERRRDAMERSGEECLTIREKEILRLIAAGKTSREISAILNVGVKTVDKHRQHIIEKLNIHDAVGLTRYALSKSIVK